MRALKLMNACCKGSLDVWCTCNSSRDEKLSSRFFVKTKSPQQVLRAKEQLTFVKQPFQPSQKAYKATTTTSTTTTTTTTTTTLASHILSYKGYTTKTNFVQHGHDVGGMS
jgi:hypothetical protein